MNRNLRNRRIRRTGRGAGFSLVEGLVALAVLLTIVIGVIPLFTQSMVNNTAGRHITEASNFTTDAFEGMLQLPLNSDQLELAAGDLRAVRAQLLAGEEARDESGETRPGFEYRVLETRELGDVEIPANPRDALELADFQDARALAEAKWIRIIEIEHFQISALSDGFTSELDSELADDERLPGGAAESNVQLKKIQVRIIPRGQDSGLSLGQGRMTATLVKAI